MSFNLSVMKVWLCSSLLLSGSFIPSADSAAYFQLRQTLDQLVLLKTYDPISHSYVFNDISNQTKTFCLQDCWVRQSAASLLFDL